MSLLNLPIGIPDHKTLTAPLHQLTNFDLSKYFSTGLIHTKKKYPYDIIAFTAKTLDGLKEKYFHSATHVISDTSLHIQLFICLFQIDQKANEITVILILVETSMIEGCIAIIIAMGCRNEMSWSIKTGQIN
ncbi:hypothetical protein MASR2M12_21510 [Bacteroidales bacterium]